MTDYTWVDRYVGFGWVKLKYSDLNTCDTIQEDSQQQQSTEQTRQEQSQTVTTSQVVQQTDTPVQVQHVQHEPQRELAPDELELEELTKKCVTSKTCQQITQEEAQKLVDSQTCRPGTVLQ